MFEFLALLKELIKEIKTQGQEIRGIHLALRDIVEQQKNGGEKWNV